MTGTTPTVVRRTWPIVVIIAGVILCWAGSALAAPFAYITNTGAGTVEVIDTATNTIVATIPTGPSPAGVVVNRAGTRVYITSELGKVSVIDTSTNTVVAT